VVAVGWHFLGVEDGNLHGGDELVWLYLLLEIQSSVSHVQLHRLPQRDFQKANPGATSLLEM
jgi:hypothetical protein